MPIPFSPHAIWLFGVALLLFWVAVIVWQRAALAHEPLGLTLSTGAWWTLLYGLELTAMDDAGKLFWFHLKHLGVTTITAWWVLFVLEFTRSPYHRDKRVVFGLTWLSILSFILIWTNDWHHLFFRSLDIVEIGGVRLVQAIRGPFFLLHLVATYTLLLGSVIQFLRHSRLTRSNRQQQIFLLLALLVPWGANILYELRLGPMPAIDYAPFAMATTGLAVTWVLFDMRIMQLIPLKPALIFEAVSDGMVLLDTRGTIVAINPTAREMLGNEATELLGQPLGRLAPAAAHLHGPTIHGNLIEFPWRGQFFELRPLHMSSRFRQPRGQLFVLTNVTRRKQSELEREGLIDQLQAALAQSRALYRSSRAVIGLDDLPTQLQAVTEEIYVALAVDQVVMVLLEHEKEAIALMVQARPQDGISLSSYHETVAHPLVSQALASAQLATRHVTASEPVLAVAPIRYRGEQMGFLIVYDHSGLRVLNQSEGQLLAAMAGHAAIAISNSRLFEEVHHLATTDGLTGLYNRRHLLTLADLLFRHAQQMAQPLAVLLLDVDLFKQINDHLGHTVGDEVLRGIADLLRDAVRDEDLVGRYGGEEFVLVLPQTRLSEAIELAEALRRRIAATIFPTARGPVTTTISVGAAQGASGFASFLSLLDQADEALYRAKGEGRNRVIHAAGQ